MIDHKKNRRTQKTECRRKRRLVPICPRCNNTERFEIEESTWDKDERGNQILIEKVKCMACGTFLEAIYKLVQWKA